MRRCDGRWCDAMDGEAMRWTMRRCYGAMRWTMRRCDGRWGDAMDDAAMRWSDGNIAPSHRPIASPHRPSHRLIVHRIASSSIASPHRLPLRNAAWTTGCFRAHAWRTGTLRIVLLRNFRNKVKGRNSYNVPVHVLHGTDALVFIWWYSSIIIMCLPKQRRITWITSTLLYNQ